MIPELGSVWILHVFEWIPKSTSIWKWILLDPVQNDNEFPMLLKQGSACKFLMVLNGFQKEIGLMMNTRWIPFKMIMNPHCFPNREVHEFPMFLSAFSKHVLWEKLISNILAW